MVDVAAQLEAALTSGGTLLVWAEKYRHEDPSALANLRRDLLAVGDRARRLSRHEALDEDAARELLDAATAINAGIRQLIERRKSDATYQRAVALHAAGDLAALATVLPEIFAGVRTGLPPVAAFWEPVWQRRGRPLTPAELVAELRTIATTGIPGTGDDLSPGTDAALPAVLLGAGRPPGAPLALRIDGALLPRPVLHLADGRLLVPGAALRLSFTVALAAADEPLDEWIADPASYLQALERACRDHGFAVSR
ncbi:MAG TPA: hypothetical protein VNO26_00860 [Candidatus Limnocylindria bacterium]|nr:hypothetical protein [Candidatus Limnocylindria bacterium]